MTHLSLEDTIGYIKSIESEVENQPEVTKAKELATKNFTTSKLTDTEKYKQKTITMFKFVLNLLIVEGKSLHGNAYVEPDLKKQSAWLASFLTATNLINIITSSPIIFIAGKSVFLNPLPSLFVNTLILCLLNISGTIAVSKSPNKNISSRVALSAFVVINTLLSLGGGIGTELMLNRSKLAQTKAHQLIVEPYAQKLEDLKESEEVEQLKALEQEIEERKTTLNEQRSQYGENKPLPLALDREYRELYGSYNDQQSKNLIEVYGLDVSQWPLVPQLNERKRIFQEKVNSAEEELIAIKKNVTEEKAINYLQEEEEELYQRNFDEEGLISAPPTEISVAIRLWIENFVTFQWYELGFSLYLFVLSIITSIFSIYLMIAHSKRDDLPLSWSKAVTDAREAWFDEKVKILVKAESQSIVEENSSNGHHKILSMEELELED